MVGFARAMNDEGVATLRFNFPYIESGRRAPDPAPYLEETWRAAFAAAGARAKGEPVWAGGKSLGGRIASMARRRRGMPAAGLVFLGYPLHPPGKPERIRDEHLYRIEVPMIFVEGTRDPFATPELLAGVVAKLGDRADADLDRGRRPLVRTSRGRSATRARSPPGWPQPVARRIRERMR